MKKLLIVDDSKVIRRIIKRSHGLVNCGVVGMAEDGVAAIRLAQKTRPDLITIDITMPNMNGIEAIPKLKVICPAVRILVVSAMADKTTAIRALSAGAHGFLCKPFTGAELVEAMKELAEDE